ncbi:MAG TPA: pilus assembly protein TadG-related protein [Terriglobia bacterium]|nr:pilus assembly protein TadG-related protein [Terriglobia bacterium]
MNRGNSGQALAVTCLAMSVLMGATGLAVDMGYLRYTQRRMQTAADAAALTAAAELNYGDYVSAGLADAAANGFTNGANNVTVAVNSPPTEGAYAGQSNYAEVIVTDSVPTFFMKMLGINSEQVSARAVGHYNSSTNCVYALSPNATNAIHINGTVSFTAQCGVVDDSNASPALLMDGASGSLSATSIAISGSYTNNGSGLLSPTPTTSAPPQSDPLAYLSAPPVGTCTYSSAQNFNSSASLTQGVYCGGISVGGNANVNFASGTYVINGGQLSFGGSSTITGSNVMFYLTGGASLSISGGTTVTLSAPTSGTYSGILFFQDRTDSSAASFQGGNSMNLTGGLYFPDAALEFKGNNSSSAYGIIVASTLLFDGNSTINDNYSSLSNGSPIKSATLAE